jgi:hypothetical protein
MNGLFGKYEKIAIEAVYGNVNPSLWVIHEIAGKGKALGRKGKSKKVEFNEWILLGKVDLIGGKSFRSYGLRTYYGAN